jgi:adenylate kinase family enzyme
MKIAIIWDTAAGKSTFGDKLSKELKIPIYHTDLWRINKQGKKEENNIVKEKIQKTIKKTSRIIEWNALRADPKERFKHADIIFLFDFPKHITLKNVIVRWIHIKFNKQKRKWFHENRENKTLSLNYYIPYIFKNFPKRKKQLKQVIQNLDKKIIIFTSRSDINNYNINDIHI